MDARVDWKGRITLPEALRQTLGLKEGMLLRFTPDRDRHSIRVQVLRMSNPAHQYIHAEGRVTIPAWLRQQLAIEPEHTPVRFLIPTRRQDTFTIEIPQVNEA